MEQILHLVEQYGVDTCLLALCIGVSTGLVKIPLKALSRKKNWGNRLNKYITLFPLAFGVLYAGLYQLFACGRFWSENTAVLAATSASLSLALYAILEKFFAKTEIQSTTAPETMLDSATVEEPQPHDIATEKEPAQKIIIGRKQDETQTKDTQISG